MTNKWYDFFKWLVWLFLPALATLIGVVGQALGWGNVDLVVTIITAITAFLGTITGVSNIKYNQQDK